MRTRDKLRAEEKTISQAVESVDAWARYSCPLPAPIPPEVAHAIAHRAAELRADHRTPAWPYWSVDSAASVCRWSGYRRIALVLLSGRAPRLISERAAAVCRIIRQRTAHVGTTHRSMGAKNIATNDSDAKTCAEMFDSALSALVTR